LWWWWCAGQTIAVLAPECDLEDIAFVTRLATDVVEPLLESLIVTWGVVGRRHRTYL
jgi:hypothetical protein